MERKKKKKKGKKNYCPNYFMNLKKKKKKKREARRMEFQECMKNILSLLAGKLKIFAQRLLCAFFFPKKTRKVFVKVSV